MKRLAILAFAAGAALTTGSVAFAQYYEPPRQHYQERQHYRPECPHGYKYSHGRCVEIVVRRHCEDGWVWRDGHCRPPARRHYNSY